MTVGQRQRTDLGVEGKRVVPLFPNICRFPPVSGEVPEEHLLDFGSAICLVETKLFFSL